MGKEDNTRYQCEIAFISAENVPVADLKTLSCDPYLKATVQVEPQAGYSDSDFISYRTHTIHNTLNPVFNSRWVVSGIPPKGFRLTVKLLDEDWRNWDNCLGRTVIQVPQHAMALNEAFDTGAIAYKVEKRRGSLLTYLYTYIASVTSKVNHHVQIWIRIRVVGKAESQDLDGGRVYTVGPPRYSRHFSPLIGHIVSRGTARQEPLATGKRNRPLAATTFVANRLQLKGPAPSALRLRYVGYVPAIKSLYKKSGIRGRLLHFALKRQFNTIYGYSQSTIYGVAGEGEIKTDRRLANETESTTMEDLNKANAIAREFLGMTSHGTAGRIFTYIITLDSELRFTETGQEFSINLLSKHAMHAEAAKEIAFSGEFFLRRLVNDVDNDSHHVESSPSEETATDTSITKNQSDDPHDYELVVSNSSGTYRPPKDLLPILQEWLSEEGNFSALGKVTAVDCFDETLLGWKKERQEEKRLAKGLTSGQKEPKGKQKDVDASGGIAKMEIPKRRKFRGVSPSLGSLSSGPLRTNSSSASDHEVRSTLMNKAAGVKDIEDEGFQALVEMQTTTH